MRPALACLLVAVTVAPAVAQAPQFLAVVTDTQVTVRGGPGDKFPDTEVLAAGAVVVVHHDESNGWLAIQPPPGSVSWVPFAFVAGVKPDAGFPQNGTIDTDGDEVGVAAGRLGLARPLPVQRTRLPNGCAVRVVGPKVKDDDGVRAWYPIAPQLDDFRYIPRSAVRMDRPAKPDQFVVRSSDPKVTPAGGSEPVPASIPNRPATTTGGRTKPADWPNHPLWHQAEQAERAADYPRAETLYLKLAAEMNQPGGDAELANLCYARVHAVREKMRQGKGTSSVGRGDPPAAEGRWVGPGLLRRVTFKIDGREAFALEGDRGQVKCYAIPAGDVDLDRYVRSEVILYGQLSYSPDLRAWVVTASRLQLARDR